MSYTHLEILVEELSMDYFLREVLPQILPPAYKLGENCFIRPHQGKSHLKKSIPKKVKAFSNMDTPTKLIIIHDQDSNDCIKLKKDLVELVEQNGDLPVLVRIACRELEAWYLGDMDAIEKVYPRFKASQHRNKKKFRDPDHPNPSDELAKLIPEFGKTTAAREIPKHMDLENNRSVSFNHLISGIRRFLS